MKRLVIFCLCSFLVCCFATKAQQVQIGITSESRNGELKSTDPLNGKQHYTSYPISLKKGAGIIFFMESKVFSPFVILYSQGDRKYFGLPYFKIEENKIKEARVTFTAPADTSFYVILSSVEENTTGIFNSGYYLLDSSQMNFSDNYSTCDRLTYLMNQWQLNWELMLVNEEVNLKKNGPTVSAKNLINWKTLVKNKSGIFLNNKYEEKIFSLHAGVDDKKKVTEFYKKICADIKNCLDINEWKIETEGEFQLQEFMVYITNPIVTNFIFKGAVKNQELKSFKIVVKPPPDSWKLEGRFDVLLIFN